MLFEAYSQKIYFVCCTFYCIFYDTIFYEKLQNEKFNFAGLRDTRSHKKVKEKCLEGNITGRNKQ